MSSISLGEAIRQAAGVGSSPAGHRYAFLNLEQVKLLAHSHRAGARDVEIAALRQEIVPERYERNLGTIGIQGQLTLLKSKVAVIGLGGLGGLVAELLARMGVGKLVLVDGDSFTGSNLNRQLMAFESNMGRQKAVEAAARIASINSSLEVSAHPVRAGVKEFRQYLAGTQVVVDCLDNLPSRFDLEDVCQELQIPLVHGAIAGNMGQVAVIWPGQPLFPVLYGFLSGAATEEGGQYAGAEKKLGNPASTPAMIASWQAGETVKVLVNQDNALRGEILYVDMMAGELYKVRFN